MLQKIKWKYHSRCKIQFCNDCRRVRSASTSPGKVMVIFRREWPFFTPGSANIKSAYFCLEQKVPRFPTGDCRRKFGLPKYKFSAKPMVALVCRARFFLNLRNSSLVNNVFWVNFLRRFRIWIRKFCLTAFFTRKNRSCLRNVRNFKKQSHNYEIP